MSFLTPWFLVGLLAVAGPLIFHLRRLSVRERVRFGLVELLDVRPPKSSRRKWENLLLMMLRIAALAVLSFSFARPYLSARTGGGASTGETNRVLVLLDASASMRRGTLFKDAVAAAAHAVEGLADGDECEVAVFARSVRTLVTFDEWNATPKDARRSLVRRALEEVSPTWEAGSLDEALRHAVERYPRRDRHAAGRVVVVSDFQEGTRILGLQGFHWPPNFSVQLSPVTLPGSAVGGDVSLHWIAPDLEKGDAGELVRVQVRAGDHFVGGKVRLEAKGDGVDSRDVPVTPGRASLVTLQVPKGGRGEVRVGGDGGFGSSVWVSKVPQNRRLVAVGGAGGDRNREGGMYFVQKGLEALGESRVEVASVESLSPERDAQVALWVTQGGVDPVVMERIRRSVQTGGTALVFVEGTSVEGSLKKLLGDGVQLEEEAPRESSVLGFVEREHPVFKPFKVASFSDFSGIHFWKYRKVDLPAERKARVLARFDNGTPALLECELGRGRVFVWPGSWNPADSQWPLSSRCVPFLSACVEIGGASLESGSGGFGPRLVTAVPGDLVPVPSSVRELRGVSGEVVPVRDGGARVESPGVYEAVPGGGVVVVNMAEEETRFAALAPEVLESLGVPLVARVHTDHPRASVGDAPRVDVTEGGQEFWRWGLACVCLLLISETLVSGWLSKSAGGSV